MEQNIKQKFLSYVCRLGFDTTLQGCVNALLAAYYIIYHCMQPYGYWYQTIPDRALNHHKKDFKYIFSKAEVWQDFVKKDAHDLVSFFRYTRLIDILTSLPLEHYPEYLHTELQSLCRQPFSIILHLYLVLSIKGSEYSEYCTLFQSTTNSLRLKDYAPLAPDRFRRLQRAIHGEIEVFQPTIPVEALLLKDKISEYVSARSKIIIAFLDSKHMKESRQGEMKYQDDLLAFSKAVYPHSEASIECSLIFGRIFHRRNRTYLLVNPSLHFLELFHKKILEVNEDECLSNNISPKVVVISNTEIRTNEYKSMFHNFTFEPLNAYMVDEHEKFDSVYIGATQLKSGQLKDLLLRLQNQVTKNCDFHILFPDKKKSELVQAQASTASWLSVLTVDRMPKGISSVAPTKKCIASIRFGEKTIHNTQLRTFTLDENNGYWVLRNKKSISITNLDWMSDNSIEILENNEHIVRREKKYKESSCFFYSREIRVHYWCYKAKADRYRLIAVMKFPKNPIEGDYHLISCEDTKYEKTLHCNESGLEKSIADWIRNTYIKKPTVISSIREHYRYKYLKDSPLSLRSFCFLMYGDKKAATDSVWGAIDKIAQDEELGELMIGQACGPEYENAIKLFTANCKAKEAELYWDSLGRILDDATIKGFYPASPFSIPLSKHRDERAAFEDIRRGMVKKTMTIDEMKALISLINKVSREDIRGLAVLARLLTGLSPAELSALHVKDLHYNRKVGVHLLFVQALEIIGSDGKADIAAPKEVKYYREIPLMPVLTEKLTSWCKDKSAEDFVFTRNNKRITAKEIRDFSRKLLKKILPEHNYLILPMEEGEDDTTDLVSYRGDFFRSNFAFHLREVCRMNEDQLAYLLGNKQKTTYGRSYKDHRKFFILKGLSIKLERLYAVLFGCQEDKQEISFSKTFSLAAKANRTVAIVDVTLQEGEILSIECVKGMSATIEAE